MMVRIIRAIACQLTWWTAAIVAAAVMAVVPAHTQTPAAQNQGTLSQAQLEQLVAPVALYPDNLLSQVLMASTYPLEVIEAARWSKANPNVSGAALQNAMQQQTWDPTVKALTAMPQILQMMSDKLDWTQQLGDAFLAQQQDVLDAVQKLRARADAAGNLKTTAQQTVTKSSPPAGVSAPAGLQQVISIEPTNPDDYYVPIYNPILVYGVWPWPDYQPFYWYPAGWSADSVYGFAGVVVVGGAVWANVNWWNLSVGINANRFNQFNRTSITRNTWTHDPRHRGNVPYRNAAVARRFHQTGRDLERNEIRRRGTSFDRRGREGAGNPGARFGRVSGGARRTVRSGGGERRALRGRGGGRPAFRGGGGGHRAFRGGGERRAFRGGGGGRRAFRGGGRGRRR